MKLTKSPRINQALYEMGIFDYKDVIEHLPRKYDDFSSTKEIGLKDKDRVVIYGRVMSLPTFAAKRKISISQFDFMSENKNYFKVIAYNRPYLRSTLKLGEFYTVLGVYDFKNTRINALNIVKGKISTEDSLKPIYTLPSDYQNYQFRNLVKKAFEEEKGKIFNNIPYDFINKYRLVDKETALKYVHFPRNAEDVRQGFRHLKYEEALVFSIKNQLIREENKSLAKVRKEPIDISLTKPFIDSLPYELTKDQYQAADEIIDDMNQSALMYRLLQGDVGTGKTVVSFIALYANYLRGDQGALMAPTDALARQHYENANKLFAKQKLKIALLLGSTPIEEKRSIISDLSDGIIDIIIGTHALFSKSTRYSSLGLVIIDEQHRFGVNQRMLLASKGDHADLLMMSATPIPRSLALSIYGDLDVSTLSLFPSSSRVIRTSIVESDDKLIDETIETMLKENRQIYIVAPLIDLREDERYSIDKLAGHYLLKYPGKVSVLHGKMKQEDKELALENFYSNKTPILVSTPIIEVGIDVKNAGAMIIYDANNFGLASLHQLRGRIGRDGRSGTCLLIYDKDDEEVEEKLNVLVQSNDGFYIAEQDLKMRGPGEMMGLKQSGLPNFAFLNIVNDYKIFVVAREDAKLIMNAKEEKKYKWIIAKCVREIQKDDFVKA